MANMTRKQKVLCTFGALTVLWWLAKVLTHGAPIFRAVFGFVPNEAEPEDGQTAVTSLLKIAGKRAVMASRTEIAARESVVSAKSPNMWLWLVWFGAKKRFIGLYGIFHTASNLAEAYGFKVDHKLPELKP